MKILTFLFTLFLLASCGKQGAKSKLNLQVGNLAVGSSYGDTYLWVQREVKDADTGVVSLRDPLKIDMSGGTSTEVPYGTWTFRMIVWDGPGMAGSYSCGKLTSVLLDQPEVSLPITLTIQDCKQEYEVYKVMLAEKVGEKTGCPTGFVSVPADATLGTSAFCTMKYLPTQDNNSINGFVSDENGGGSLFYRNINAFEAFNKCKSYLEPGFSGEFALISNKEYVAIARNAEAQGINWTAGTVGSGSLVRGWAAVTTPSGDDAFSNTTVAPSSLSTCQYNNGADSCSGVGSPLYRRWHQLSNGEQVWDYGGNLMSWADWDSTDSGLSFGPYDIAASFQDYPTAEPSLDPFEPLVATTGANYAGKFFGGNGGVLRRGGIYNYGFNSSIYALFLNSDGQTGDGLTSFRCVYRF